MRHHSNTARENKEQDEVSKIEYEVREMLEGGELDKNIVDKALLHRKSTKTFLKILDHGIFRGTPQIFNILGTILDDHDMLQKIILASTVDYSTQEKLCELFGSLSMDPEECQSPVGNRFIRQLTDFFTSLKCDQEWLPKILAKQPNDLAFLNLLLGIAAVKTPINKCVYELLNHIIFDLNLVTGDFVKNKLNSAADRVEMLNGLDDMFISNSPLKNFVISLLREDHVINKEIIKAAMATGDSWEIKQTSNVLYCLAKYAPDQADVCIEDTEIMGYLAKYSVKIETYLDSKTMFAVSILDIFLHYLVFREDCKARQEIIRAINDKEYFNNDTLSELELVAEHTGDTRVPRLLVLASVLPEINNDEIKQAYRDYY